MTQQREGQRQPFDGGLSRLQLSDPAVTAFTPKDGSIIVFMQPNAMSEQNLSSLKQEISFPEGEDEEVDFVPLQAPATLDDLLQVVRHFQKLTPYFFIIDQQSAQKNALLAVETDFYDRTSDQVMFSAAIDTRTFYVAPQTVTTVAQNLFVANLSWEDFEPQNADEVCTMA